MTATQGKPAWIITWDSYNQKGREDFARFGEPGQALAVLPANTSIEAVRVAVDAFAQLFHFDENYRPNEEYAVEPIKAEVEGSNVVRWEIQNPHIVAYKVTDLHRPNPDHSSATQYTVPR